MVTHEVGDRFMLAILAASASYIAVPAAMKIAAPQGQSGFVYPYGTCRYFPV